MLSSRLEILTELKRAVCKLLPPGFACGLDPNHVHFYRQSDILEVPELNWILNLHHF